MLSTTLSLPVSMETRQQAVLPPTWAWEKVAQALGVGVAAAEPHSIPP